VKCRVDYPDGSHTVTDNLTEDESEAPLTHAVVFLENHRWSVWDGYSDQKDAAEAARLSPPRSPSWPSAPTSPPTRPSSAWPAWPGLFWPWSTPKPSGSVAAMDDLERVVPDLPAAALHAIALMLRNMDAGTARLEGRINRFDKYTGENLPKPRPEFWRVQGFAHAGLPGNWGLVAYDAGWIRLRFDSDRAPWWEVTDAGLELVGRALLDDTFHTDPIFEG